LGWKLKGQRVAFVTDSAFGSYAEYAIADVNMCMELPNSISLAEGCCSFVNPLSVVCMYELVQGAPCVISTAAGSQLGRMLMRYLQQKGINVINIVRSEASEK
jgi:NADPH:quinone reductase